MSVLFDFRSTWFPASFVRIPIPRDRTKQLIAELQRVGNRLFQLDAEISEALVRLEQMTQVEDGISRPLRLARPVGIELPDKDSWMLGGKSQDLEVSAIDDAIVVSRPGQLFGPSVSGASITVPVKDAVLRRWVQFIIESRIAVDEPLTHDWFRNIPIPNDVAAQLERADRLRRNAARMDLVDEVDELDAVTAQALGIANADRDYIMKEMKTDPFLTNIAPAWRHLASRTRGYTAYGDRSRYH